MTAPQDREPPTPGQLALREAARLETARVYSQLCPEHPQEPVSCPHVCAHPGARKKTRQLRIA